MTTLTDPRAKDCVYVADGRSGELAGASRLGMRVVQVVIDTVLGEEWAGEKASSLTAVADLALGPV